MLKLVGSLAVLLVFTGCAYSPQQIHVAPVFSPLSEAVGGGRSVHVRVSDGRQNKVLGSRGGSYRDTALVTLENDLAQSLSSALATQLQSMGYVVDSLQADTVDLHLIVDSLVYDNIDADGPAYTINMGVVTRVEAARGGDQYQGHYRIKRQQNFFSAPSELHNSN
ncbi:MAG: YajG family lipoprotein, partial [Spongiibacteraceae bacterium]